MGDIDVTRELYKIEVLSSRLQSLESKVSELNNSITQLTIGLTKAQSSIETLSEVASKLDDLESDKLRQLELHVNDNSRSISLMKWMGLAAGGAIITSLVSAFSDLLGKN